MRIKAILTCVILFLSSGNIFAQSVAFTDAANGWLNGSEESNLLKLSKLAKAGDTDAQMLLGQIERDTPPGGYSDFLVNLNPSERATLLRFNAGGQLTTNWLLSLSDAELTSFGRAVFDYNVSRDFIGNAIALQKHGEVAGAEYVLWRTFNDGRIDLINSMTSENYGLSDAGFLGWVKTYIGGSNRAITMNRLLEDPSPDMIYGLLGIKRLANLLGLSRNFSTKTNQFITVMKGQGYNLPDDANLVEINANIAQIAQTDAPLNLVIRACSKCTQEAADFDCIIQSLEIIGGYKELQSIRTPVERVISVSDYIESERALLTLENMVVTRSNYYVRPIRSECIAEMIAR